MRRETASERDALCHALARVVDERGWVGTSPALVSREAGLTTNEFYDTFRSLEHCYLETYDRALTRAARTARRAVTSVPLAPGPESWRDHLDALFGAVLNFFSVEPVLARTCLVDVLAVGPAARARRDRTNGQFVRYVEDLRLAHGEPIPPVATEMIVLGTTELISRRVARGEAERLPELLPQLRPLWSRAGVRQGPQAPAALVI